MALRFVPSGIFFAYNHAEHRALVFGTSNVLVRALIFYVAHHLI